MDNEKNVMKLVNSIDLTLLYFLDNDFDNESYKDDNKKTFNSMNDSELNDSQYDNKSNYNYFSKEILINKEKAINSLRDINDKLNKDLNNLKNLFAHEKEEKESVINNSKTLAENLKELLDNKEKKKDEKLERELINLKEINKQFKEKIEYLKKEVYGKDMKINNLIEKLQRNITLKKSTVSSIEKNRVPEKKQKNKISMIKKENNTNEQRNSTKVSFTSTNDSQNKKYLEVELKTLKDILTKKEKENNNLKKQILDNINDKKSK